MFTVKFGQSQQPFSSCKLHWFIFTFSQPAETLGWITKATLQTFGCLRENMFVSRLTRTCSRPPLDTISSVSVSVSLASWGVCDRGEECVAVVRSVCEELSTRRTAGQILTSLVSNGPWLPITDTALLWRDHDSEIQRSPNYCLSHNTTELTQDILHISVLLLL